MRKLAAVALGASLLLALLWAGSGDESGTGRLGEEGAAVGTVPAGSVAATAVQAPAARALPASLRGTGVDGGFVVDEDGHLVPTPDAIALFDYFLAASGEEPLPALRARILAEIHGRLAPRAAREAEALLDRYLAYRDEARLLFESGGEGLSLERRVQRIRELRRQAFGADVAQALFGAEEERWFTELELRRVALDPELDPAERSRRIEALEAELPPDVREAREISQAALQLRRDEAALRARGASEAEIHAVRADRFGEEAAHRLAALDAERAHWDARLAAWQAERARILAEGHDDPEAAIDAARRARFEGAELRRIRAVDASVQASAAPASRP